MRRWMGKVKPKMPKVERYTHEHTPLLMLPPPSKSIEFIFHDESIPEALTPIGELV